MANHMHESHINRYSKNKLQVKWTNRVTATSFYWIASVCLVELATTITVRTSDIAMNHQIAVYTEFKYI